MGSPVAEAAVPFLVWRSLTDAGIKDLDEDFVDPRLWNRVIWFELYLCHLVRGLRQLSESAE